MGVRGQNFRLAKLFPSGEKAIPMRFSSFQPLNRKNDKPKRKKRRPLKHGLLCDILLLGGWFHIFLYFYPFFWGERIQFD